MYDLAIGKVVLGGVEKVGLEALGVDNSPVFYIRPLSKSIVDAVEKLIECKKFPKLVNYHVFMLKNIMIMKTFPENI
ncbi:hypothetical protein [Galenea microaerophila]